MVAPLDSAHHQALSEVLQRLSKPKQVPAHVTAKARHLLLDTLGCVLSGRTAPPVRQFEQLLGTIDPGTFRFPSGPCLSSTAAASVAAMASAWDEGCEGLPYAHGRPALALIAALMPVALQREATLDQLLHSLITGYEVGARAGGWLRIAPGMHVDGNWPAVGAAAGAAHLMGLTPAAQWNAVSIAACQLPTSLYLPIRTGDDARNTYPAHAATLGLQSAIASAAGITAPDQALLDYARDHARPDGRPAPEPTRWMILESYFKPHAGVRHAHYGLEAAMRIRARLGGRSDRITGAHLRIYPEASIYAGNRDPQAPITAQFSLSLGVAAGLRFGAMDPDLFRGDQLNDAELRRLESLVTIEPVEALGADGQRAAELAVQAGSDRFTEAIDELDGSPSRPMSPERVAEKFVRYSTETVGAQQAHQFARELTDSPGTVRFARLWQLLVP